MEKEYLEKIYSQFELGGEDKELFEKIFYSSLDERNFILQNIQKLLEHEGLALALITLYRQQVNSGFVLADPLIKGHKEYKYFSDPVTGVEFCIQWNPDRELRKNHELLIERGVISEKVNEIDLINIDENGKPCYLCKENIAILNPAEILIYLTLAGDKYICGANFASITNNHFTIISSDHKQQSYERNLLTALIDFVEKTDGHFRSIFNGQAGASILSHLHFQATTEKFPIEDIRINSEDIINKNENIRVIKPKYYIPVYLVESVNKDEVCKVTDKVVSKWHSINKRDHTINILAVKNEDKFRVFIFLRDKTKLVGEGKEGAIGTFECAGILVLSYGIFSNRGDENNERVLFENSSLDAVKNILGEIASSVSFPLKF